MKNKQIGVRGNNKISQTLNKPIEGRLAEKESNKFVIIVLLCLFLVILAYSIKLLGFKTGLLFSIGFSVSAMAFYFMSDRQQKENQEIIKKHPWKAFENDDK